MMDNQFLKKLQLPDTHSVITVDSFISVADCKKYSEEILCLPKTIPSVATYSEDNSSIVSYGPNTSYKVCDVVHLRFNDYWAPLYNMLSKKVEQLNNQAWKYSLWGWAENDPANGVIYSRKNDKFDWHMDWDSQYTSRKLTAIVQLTSPNEYTGATLQVKTKNGIEDIDRSQGSLTVFPAYMPHRVTELKSGSRIAAVFPICGSVFT